MPIASDRHVVIYECTARFLRPFSDNCSTFRVYISTRRENHKTIFITTYIASILRIRSMLRDKLHKILLYWLHLPVVLLWETYVVYIVKRSEKSRFTA